MDRQPLAQTSTSNSFAYPRRADLVIRAGAIHSMTQERTVYHAIAIRDERIVALSGDPHGLDALLPMALACSTTQGLPCCRRSTTRTTTCSKLRAISPWWRSTRRAASPTLSS